jgi:hypothetical protein
MRDSGEKRPPGPKPLANTAEPDRVDIVAGGNLCGLAILRRVDALSDRMPCCAAREARSYPVKFPSRGELAEEVGVYEGVAGGGEGGQAAGWEAIVTRPAEGEEDVGCLAETFERGLCRPQLAEFFAEAVAVPGLGMALQAEEAMPAAEETIQRRHFGRMGRCDGIDGMLLLCTSKFGAVAWRDWVVESRRAS